MTLSHEIPGRPCKHAAAESFTIKNDKDYLYIVDYYSKFSVIKWVEGLSTDNLIKHV